MVEINDILNLALNLSDDIIIMGHNYIDLDALGSALGLLKFCLDNNKNAHIFINPNQFNSSVVKAMELLPFSLKSYFISNIEDIKPNDKSLLIVLDCNKENTIESMGIFNKFDNTIVIDHHENSSEKLKSTINYVDSEASSMVEIICEFLKSNDYDLNNNNISSIMYTGLCIDTNNFDNNTKAKTMKAAAYLLENGAEIKTKKILFQEKKEDILNRGRLLKRSTTIDENTMICVLDANIYTRDELAKISNELLKFDKIDTAYTIGKIATNTIGISARCFEDKDVEQIMELLGGGGHKNAAAAAISGVTLNKARDMLLSCINKKDEIDIDKKLVKK
ncbi:MAG: DHH family phosphoesterase [Bacilli bacterium]